MLQADIESLSVCMVCAGVCKHAELPTCFLSENMVRSGCQVQPRALPAAAMVRLQGAVLDGAGEQTEPVVRTGVEAAALRGGVALLALTSPKTEMVSGRSNP